MDGKEHFLINGKGSLSGEIEVRGCKNAATPIIAAALLTDEPCYIQNLPLVEDIFRMIEIIETLGAKVDWQGEREIKIEARNIDPSKMEEEIIKKLRSSVFLFGPLLPRFKKVKLRSPGGCLIGVRPIDAHLKGFEQIGADIEKEGKYYVLFGDHLVPGEVILPEFSVTATENILMAASLLSGKTIVKIAAIEPHVKDLSCVLSKMGAGIKWSENHTVEINGQKKLHGFSHSLIYDPVEAGSFIILAGASRGDIVIRNAPLENLDLVIQKLREFGISFEKLSPSPLAKPYHLKRKVKGKGDRVKEIQGISDVRIRSKKKLSPVQKIQVLPYPGIPTDLQCAFGVLATQNSGKTLIHDPMYEGRLRYLEELNKMGADISLLDIHRAIVNGPSRLQGISIKNYDLRSGAALIIAGLIAEGKTSISDAYQVDRGYEKIEDRLRSIGADIKRVKI